MKAARLVTALIDYLQEPAGQGKVTTEWVDPDRTIILQTYNGNWAWRDSFWGLMRVNYDINQSSHPVDVIFDFTNTSAFPRAIWAAIANPSYDWFWDRKRWPKKLQHMMIVGGGETVDQLFSMRRQLAPDTLSFFRKAETLEEALRILEAWSHEPNPS